LIIDLDVFLVGVGVEGRGKGRGNQNGTISPFDKVFVDSPTGDVLIESDCFVDAVVQNGQDAHSQHECIILKKLDIEEFQGCDTISIGHSENTDVGIDILVFDEFDGGEMIDGGPLTGPPPPIFNKKYKFIQKEKTKQSKSTLS
jgi:hypothetical protein